MKLKLCCLLLIAVLADVTQAQTVALHRCKDYTNKTQENFNLERYMGRWYELKRLENLFEFNGDCTTADYSLNDDGTVKVVNSQKNLQTGRRTHIEGYAVLAHSNKHNGKLLVTFPLSPDGRYWVLETDYDNYSVVWSCYDFGPISTQFLWVLTRKVSPPEEILTKIDKILELDHLNGFKIRNTINDASACNFQSEIK